VAEDALAVLIVSDVFVVVEVSFGHLDPLMVSILVGYCFVIHFAVNFGTLAVDLLVLGHIGYNHSLQMVDSLALD
jgi:hypothetical protein